jgi:hAT family C-terminal dimerisation region
MIASIRALEPSLRATGQPGSASAADFRALEDATAARAFGTTCARIQVTLIQGIHLLAALLDPALADLETVGIDLLPGAARALERFFVSSKFVFKSEDMEVISVQQRIGVLRRQLTACMSRSGLFANGIWASRKPGANVSVALLIANGWLPDGWWREVSSGTPELCRVATRVLAMVQSSCPVERSFSLQKRIHAKARNRLAHEAVRQLMFVLCNVKLLEPNEPVGDDDLDFLESAMVAAVACDESVGEAELADAGGDADSVMHLAEGDNNDDDDGVGEIYDDSGGDDE